MTANRHARLLRFIERGKIGVSWYDPIEDLIFGRDGRQVRRDAVVQATGSLRSNCVDGSKNEAPVVVAVTLPVPSSGVPDHHVDAPGQRSRPARRRPRPGLDEVRPRRGLQIDRDRSGNAVSASLDRNRKYFRMSVDLDGRLRIRPGIARKALRKGRCRSTSTTYCAAGRPPVGHMR